MLTGKKLFATFLAFIVMLSVSSFGFAFASPKSKTKESPLISGSTEVSSIYTVPVSTTDTGEFLVVSQASLERDTGFDIWVDPADVIEYVYLDEAIVALDQEQNIAFGLFDESAEIEQAEIYLERIDTGEILGYSAVSMADNAALFTFIFSEIEEATAYKLVEISYKLTNSEDIYRVDFSAINTDQEGSGYLFDVVTPELLEVVSAETAEDGEITAFVITDEGDFIAADTVEDAIAMADAEGAAESDTEGFTEIAPMTTPLELMPTSVSTAREDYLIVALDPGHGGGDPGAGANGLVEKDLNWRIANVCYNELLNYTGVSSMLTRGENENPGLQTRVDRAVACGASVFVSLHNNAGGGAGGAEVWIPNNASYLYSSTHTISEQLGNKILAQLSSLGLNNRGVKMRDNTLNERYPDGSLADYYTVINASRRAGIPGIIVEHAFLDVTGDANRLWDDSFLISLAQADVRGITEYYNLLTHGSVQGISSVKYRSFIGTLGWESYVYDQKVSGTVGKSKGIQAFDIQLLNQTVAGSVKYNTYVTGSGWQGWKNSGEVAGTASGSTTIQALQVELTGAMASSYDIYYRVHVAYIGWLGWAKNGAVAGSVGYDYNAEAFEVAIVPKGAVAPGSTDVPLMDKNAITSALVVYQAHVQNIGWQNAVADGETIGTTNRALRMEALTITLANQQYSGGIEYNTHCANLGWQGWKSNGDMAGTTNQARQIEAIQIRLTGEMANHFDIYYHAHSQNIGWTGWAKNGECSGSTGYGYRMEALEIRLIPKGGAAPGSVSGTYYQSLFVWYQAHVANIGWQNVVADGATAGTTNRGLRMEALTITLANQPYSGSIEYNAHCANLGWQGWKSNGATAGTINQARQMEALQIRLTGEMANYYDIYYRAHAQNIGWMGWAKNGESAGSAGYGYRMEALEIRLVVKGGAAPGSTSGVFREAIAPAGTPIMGSTSTTVAQMVRRYNATGNVYPASVYNSKGAATIQDFCQILYEEAIAEGVKPEVLFCQAMKETGWLRFGGAVRVEQCNFGGIGAIDSNPTGAATFSDVREGLRAQVQHLRAYAVPGLTINDLKYPCVDPRFSLVTKGSASTVEALSGRWASSTTYGAEIVVMIGELYRA